MGAPITCLPVHQTMCRDTGHLMRPAGFSAAPAVCDMLHALLAAYSFFSLLSSTNPVLENLHPQVPRSCSSRLFTLQAAGPCCVESLATSHGAFPLADSLLVDQHGSILRKTLEAATLLWELHSCGSPTPVGAALHGFTLRCRTDGSTPALPCPSACQPLRLSGLHSAMHDVQTDPDRRRVGGIGALCT